MIVAECKVFGLDQFESLENDCILEVISDFCVANALNLSY